MIGYWCPVLHAHLPFVRHPEQERPLEEDWLFEALTESYVPLVRVLDGLLEDGVDYRLTLGLSPTLLSMLSDPLLMARYRAHLDRLIELARREVERTGLEEPQLAASAQSYLAEFGGVRRAFCETYGSDLLRALRRHRDAGRLELLTCSATHAVLPLLQSVPEAVRAQLRVATRHHARWLGEPPVGIWLPECAYAPGLDAHLKEAGVGFSFLEAHGLTHAHPRPSRGVRAPIISPSGIAFFGRDTESATQVWSAEVGYPSHPDYREFHRDAGWELPLGLLREVLGDGMRRNVGVRYHRVTGDVELAAKEPYDPSRAQRRAAEHAAHFVAGLRERLAQAEAGPRQPPLAVSPYDAELFGHWWAEGPRFLDHVFRDLAAAGDALRPVTPSEFLARYPDCELAEPQLSSWGTGGYVEVWLNPRNDWIYPLLERSARRMVELARHNPLPTDLARRALNQAARELLLAQSSDWAFMINAGTTIEYAERRTRDHLAQFERLAEGIEARAVPERDLRRLEARDNLFPEIDFRVYT